MSGYEVNRRHYKESGGGCWTMSFVVAMGVLAFGWAVGMTMWDNQRISAAPNAEASGWCAPAALKPYFGSEAGNASCICGLESKGNEGAENLGNLGVEQSWGLFQKNGMDGESEVNYVNSGLPAANRLRKILRKYDVSSCEDGLDGTPAGLLDECRRFYFVPENNLEWASWLWRQDGWSPWGTAELCRLK